MGSQRFPCTMGSGSSSDSFKSSDVGDPERQEDSKAIAIRKLRNFEDVEFRIVHHIQMSNNHRFVVLEYGTKLDETVDGFQYDRYVLIEFGSYGFKVKSGTSHEFPRSLYGSDPAQVGYNKGADTLIDIINKHDSKYNWAFNNCWDLAGDLWYGMLDPCEAERLRQKELRSDWDYI